MLRTRFLVLAALLISAGQAQQDVTFTSESTLVVIDVSVKDKSGKVIPNLNKSDFTVLEDGKPQTVSVFEFQRLDAEAPVPTPVPAIRPTPLAPAEPAPKSVAAP